MSARDSEMGVRKDRWREQQMQRHRGRKNMASWERLQGVCFGQKPRKMWVKEAGYRGRVQATEGLGR